MWFFLSLYFALWASITVSITKRVLRSVDVLVLLAFGNLTTAVAIGVILLLRGIPTLDSIFLLSVIISFCINIVAQLSFFTAIKVAPISLTAPMASFTPLVATLFAFFVLGEIVPVHKLLGIGGIVFGAYLLHVRDAKYGLAAPIKDLLKNRGVQLMLVAQGLVGITPIFEKIAMAHTKPQEPLMVAFVQVILLTAFFFPIMLARVKDPLSQIKKNLWWFVLPAPFSALGAWAAFTSYSLTNLGYATAVFKLSTFFTILWGAFFFKEERIKERLLGGSVMIAGTLLLVL